MNTLSILIPDRLVPVFQDSDEAVKFFKSVGDHYEEIVYEYSDKTFTTRKHGSDATYLDGCGGPLCKQAHRISARTRSGSKPTLYWAMMEPIVEHLGTLVYLDLEKAAATSDDLAQKAREKVLSQHLDEAWELEKDPT